MHATAIADLPVIVRAVEANDEAETILKTADLIAQALGAKLTIVHMTGSRLNMVRMNAYDLDIDALTKNFGVASAVRTLREEVVEGIRCTAVEESADLVIVGRGHN